MRRIKSIMLFVLVNVFACAALGQSDFDKQIKKFSDTLTARIMRTGKVRVAVSNFTDLQSNVTELGKYVAEAFSIELSNGTLEVVDRSRIKELLTELKMTEEKLTNPSNALKLGQMAGIEFIITGTITPLDNTVDMTVKALDIQRGISIAGQRGSFGRTDAINNLMRNTVNRINNEAAAANVNMGVKVDASDKSPQDALFESTVSPLRPVDCTSISLGDGAKLYAGQICFENQTGVNLIFSAGMRGAQGKYYYEGTNHVPLAIGNRNCTGQIVVNFDNKDAESVESNFLFETMDGEKRKAGYFKVTVEKCKVKSIVLTKKNLLLR